MSLNPIYSLSELHEYLDAALQLEHATIPTYLTALYSIHPGTNSDAVHIIRTVLVEEMLHLTLAANLVNATKGTFKIADEGFVPSFPTYLPDGETDFVVNRQHFSRAAIENFLQIERPAKAPSEEARVVRRKKAADGLQAGRACQEPELSFYSIGEFYQEIADGLKRLEAEAARKHETIFVGDPRHQVTREYYYSGGGDIIPITDLASALAAIRLITEQGEGFGGSIFDREGEISHYYRFEQLLLGRYYQKGDEAGQPSGGPIRVDWDAVYPVRTNARLLDYPLGSEVRHAAIEFNATYHRFLERLQAAFTGHPEMLMSAVGEMFRIKEHATALLRNPIPGGDGQNAAPTFEIDEYIAATKGEAK